MKKYLTITIILLMIIFMLSGCGDNSTNNENEAKSNNTIIEQTEGTDKEQENADDIYFKALKNEIKYKDENNQDTLFSEYMNNYRSNGSDVDVKVEYTIFDLDNDSENEMIVRVESYDCAYLILNNENGIVYGFEDVARGMIMIKTDGTYNASGGAADKGVLKCKFEKNKRITEALAEMVGGKCKIAGKSVSNEDYIKYVDEFRAKEDVTFTTYIEKYDFSNNNTSSVGESGNKANSADSVQTESSFKEGIYKMTQPSFAGTEAEGYDTTITFKDGKVSFLEPYWQRKKLGTYSAKGDTLTIKYTSGNDVNSITGDSGMAEISETEVYKINGNKIIMQSTTRDQYYKSGSNIYELN